MENEEPERKNGSHWIYRKKSLELIEHSCINKVRLAPKQ